MSTGTGQNRRMYQPDGGFQESQTGFSIDASYLRHMDLEHLKSDCGWKIGVGAGSSMIKFFSKAYAEYLEGPKSEEKLHAAAITAGKRIGIRCLAAELLVTDFASTLTLDKKYSIAGEIAKAGAVICVEPMVQKIVGGIGEALPGLDEMMRWFIAPDVPLNLYSMQCEYPSLVVKIEKKRVLKKPPIQEILSSLKSEGQRHALRQLSTLAKIRHTWGDTIHQIKIRPGACLIGMSGVGKTFVARAFGAATGREVFECTISGWCVQNAKADQSNWTLSAIKEKLSNGALCIFVDELCKIKTTGAGAGGTDNWYRGCQTELMQLLDRSMGDIPLTDSQRENLKNSWILVAGAFQEIYRKKIGDVLFDESLDIELTREELEAESGIPVELWNRVGEIIQIKGPHKLELCHAFEELEIAIGFERSEAERMREAAACVNSLQGFRGLEAYAISTARKALELQKR